MSGDPNKYTLEAMNWSKLRIFWKLNMERSVTMYFFLLPVPYSRKTIQ